MRCVSGLRRHMMRLKRTAFHRSGCKSTGDDWPNRTVSRYCFPLGLQARSRTIPYHRIRQTITNTTNATNTSRTSNKSRTFALLKFENKSSSVEATSTAPRVAGRGFPCAWPVLSRVRHTMGYLFTRRFISCRAGPPCNSISHFFSRHHHLPLQHSSHAGHTSRHKRYIDIVSSVQLALERADLSLNFLQVSALPSRLLALLVSGSPTRCEVEQRRQ